LALLLAAAWVAYSNLLDEKTTVSAETVHAVDPSAPEPVESSAQDADEPTAEPAASNIGPAAETPVSSHAPITPAVAASLPAMLYARPLKLVSGSKVPLPVTLAAEDCQLELLGVAAACEGLGFKLQLARSATAKGWVVSAIGGLGDAVVADNVATFHLDGQELEYRVAELESDPQFKQALANCLLRVRCADGVGLACSLRSPAAAEALRIDPKVAQTSVALDLPNCPKELHLEVIDVRHSETSDAHAAWNVQGLRLELIAGARPGPHPIVFQVSQARRGDALLLHCAYGGFDTADLKWERMPKLLAQQKLLKPENVAQALKQLDSQLGNLKRPIPELSTPQERREFAEFEQQLLDQKQKWEQVAAALETAAAGWLIHYDLYYQVETQRVLIASTDVDAALLKVR
jgi:hypothetical protein